MKQSERPQGAAYSLKGKTVAVSGATGGIGRAFCERVARLGASLVLIDRNPQKSEALACELQRLVPDVSIGRVCADMEKLETVLAAAEALRQMPIDFLVLNAGAYGIPRHRCSTGYDNVFQINFVSPYILARLLLPHLQARGGRIVAVSSIAHRFSHCDAEDVDFSKRRRASAVYGNAKRYLTYALLELDAGAEVVRVVHPGICYTNITGNYPRLIRALIKYPMKLIFPSPGQASRCLEEGMRTPCGANEWIGPRLLAIWGRPARRRLRGCDARELEWIVQTAERLLVHLPKQM